VVIAKIKKLSPWWTEASLEQGSTTVATAPANEPKRKAPAKPKKA
jgi:hypothetical protein